jgi:hypothetical protein
VVKAGVEIMVKDMRYRLPDQDLSINMSRLPTLPRSGVIIRDISRTGIVQGRGPGKVTVLSEQLRRRRKR